MSEQRDMLSLPALDLHNNMYFPLTTPTIAIMICSHVLPIFNSESLRGENHVLVILCSYIYYVAEHTIIVC